MYRYENEEMHLEDYFQGKIHKEEIPVPPELEGRLRARIAKTGVKRFYVMKAVVAVAALCMALLMSVMFIPQVKSFAQAIPVISRGIAMIESLMGGDEGLYNAERNGYSFIDDTIKVERDGYTLLFDRLVIDEERVNFRVRASWEGLTDSLSDSPAELGNPSVFPVLRIDMKDLKYISGIDKDNILNSIKYPRKPDNCIETTVNSNLVEPGEIGRFLDKNPAYLTIGVKILKQSMKFTEDGHHIQKSEIAGEIHDFGDIQVPFDIKKVQKSEVFPLNKTISLSCGNFGTYRMKLHRLIISPTKMTVEFEPDKRSPGVWINMFKNACLRDDSGKTYPVREDVYGYSYVQAGEKWNCALNFVPSAYFSGIPRKIYFGFEGIVLSDSRKDNSGFILELDGGFPKKLERNGMELVITGARHEGGLLHLNVDTPRKDGSGNRIFDAGIGLKGSGDKSSDKGYVKNPANSGMTETAFPCEKTEAYDLIFKSISYLFNTRTEVELKLK